MISVTVKTDAMKAALADYAAKLAGAAGESLADAMDAARGTAVGLIARQTVRRTGRLQNDWSETIVGSPFMGRIVARAPYARWIDEGTRPHIIRARRARALSFVVDGVRMFRKSVKHPGTKARPFVQPAARTGELVLQAGLQKRADLLASAFSR